MGAPTDRPETMARRDREPDREGGSGGLGRDEYPLLFKGDTPRSGPGLLARILAFFREPAATAATEESPSTDPADPKVEAAEPEPPGPAARDVAGSREEHPVDVEDGDPAHRASAPAEDAAPSPPPVHRLTVQMLPGRLVPVDRTMLRQEIHFLRPSREGLPITLGGARRDPPDHVTIQHPSLERKHASMRYRGGHWWIESLVSGRPVILNGRPIPAEGGARHLKDGDRVTLGEVDFHFEQP